MNEFFCHECNSYTESKEPVVVCATCGSDDIQEVSPCCGAFIEDTRICPDCGEHV
jgi:hypothetical protein